MDRRRFHIRLELAHGGRERPDRSDVRRDVEASGRAVAPVRPCAGCRLGRDLRCGRHRPVRPDQAARPAAAKPYRFVKEHAALAARGSALGRCCGGGLASDCKLSWRFAANRAERTTAADLSTARCHAPRFECGGIRPRSAGQAQADDAVERHGAGSHLARVARHYLCDGTADRGRQVPGCGYDAGCSIADPPDGAVAAVHPRHILRPDHACRQRCWREFPYRGPYHRLFWIRNMSVFAASRKAITTSPIPAAAIYAALVVVLLFTVVTGIVDVIDQRREVASSSAMLEQLEGRRPAAVRGSSGDVTMPSGSAYLEGATVTVAGATLLQRVAGAVVKFGGNVLSTQLDLQGTASRTGFISMIASCEVDQLQLQQLLYDLEAGMPFLFVDQLVVQTPLTASGSGNGKLRVLLAVSGQWRGAK